MTEMDTHRPFPLVKPFILGRLLVGLVNRVYHLLIRKVFSSSDRETEEEKDGKRSKQEGTDVKEKRER